MFRMVCDRDREAYFLIGLRRGETGLDSEILSSFSREWVGETWVDLAMRWSML